MQSLHNADGERLYCTAEEVNLFLEQADGTSEEMQLFCYVLALTGCRISEALNLKRGAINISPSSLVFETLKRRKRGIFRAVPVPFWFSAALNEHFKNLDEGERLWSFGRTSAFLEMKRCFNKAGLTGGNASPKALRHSFAVNAIAAGVPLNMVQKWLGHSNIETTAIYANAMGPEEVKIAERFWLGARLSSGRGGLHRQ